MRKAFFVFIGLTSYSGTDNPGLKYVQNGDSISMRMEYQSYIRDICDCNYTRKTPFIYWGFEASGIVPNHKITRLGEIAK